MCVYIHLHLFIDIFILKISSCRRLNPDVKEACLHKKTAGDPLNFKAPTYLSVRAGVCACAHARVHGHSCGELIACRSSATYAVVLQCCSLDVGKQH